MKLKDDDDLIEDDAEEFETIWNKRKKEKKHTDKKEVRKLLKDGIGKKNKKEKNKRPWKNLLKKQKLKQESSIDFS